MQLDAIGPFHLMYAPPLKREMFFRDQSNRHSYSFINDFFLKPPPFPLGFPCTSMGVGGGGGGGVADITWNGPFCVERRAEYGAHT